MKKYSAFLLVLAVSACGLSFVEQRTVDAWLNCGDCRDGELGRVDSLANLEHGEVIDYLAEALNGPSAERQENVAQQFAESYARIEPALRTPITAADYIQVNLENYRAGVQKRSAQALVRIGSPEAVQELGKALAADSASGHFRGDVRAYVATLLTESTVPSVGIGLTPRAADFADTVRLSTVPAAGVTASSDVRLAGAPFEDDPVVGAWPDSIKVRILALPGTYYLVLTDPTTGMEAKADSALRVESVDYIPSTFFTAGYLEPDSAVFAPLNGWVDAIGRPAAGRPLDHHHVQITTGDTTVQAVVRWSGPGRFEAVWQGPWCDTLVFAADTTVAGNVLTDAGHPLPGATVDAYTTITGLGSTTTDRDGWFHLTGLPPRTNIILKISVSGGPTTTHFADVGSNELLLVHESAVPPTLYAARADTVETYLDGGECKTLRVVRTDRLGTMLLTRSELSLVPTVFSVQSPDGSAINMRVGQERQLAEVLLGSGGTPLNGRHFHWFSSDPSLVSVTASVLAQAISVGTATLTVASGLDRWPITITVSP